MLPPIFSIFGVIVTALICGLPGILNKSMPSAAQDAVHASLYHSSFQYILPASIGACVPFVFLMILIRWYVTKNRNEVCRIGMLSFNIFVDLLTYFKFYPNNIIDYIPCFIIGRSVCLAHFTLYYFHKSLLSSRDKFEQTISSATICITCMVLAIANFSEGSISPINISGCILLIITSFGVLYYVTKALISEHKKHKEAGPVLLQMMGSTIYAVILLYVTVGLWLTWIISFTATNSPTTFLLEYSYGHTVVLIALSITPVLATELLDFKMAFIRYISHELRTPLNVVYLGLKLLQKELIESNSTTQSQTIDEMISSCDHSLRILNDVLIYERAQSKTIELNRENLNIRIFLQDILQPFLAKAEQSGHRLCLEISRHVYSRQVRVDREKLSLVVRTLITNAFKYTPRGGLVFVKASVINGLDTISNPAEPLAEAMRTVVRITVSDNGCGISKESLARILRDKVIFDLAGVRENEGPGLSLWMAKSIIEQHAGKFAASAGFDGSSLDKGTGTGIGTTVTIEIPVIDVTLNDYDQDVPSEFSVRAGALLHRVHPVDSSPTNRNSLSHASPVEIVTSSYVAASNFEEFSLAASSSSNRFLDPIIESMGSNDSGASPNIRRNSKLACFDLESSRHSENGMVDAAKVKSNTRGSKSDELSTVQRMSSDLSARRKTSVSRVTTYDGVYQIPIEGSLDTLSYRDQKDKEFKRSPLGNFGTKNLMDKENSSKRLPLERRDPMEEIAQPKSIQNPKYPIDSSNRIPGVEGTGMSREAIDSSSSSSSTSSSVDKHEAETDEVKSHEAEVKDTLKPPDKSNESKLDLKEKLRFLFVDDVKLSRKMVRRTLMTKVVVSDDLCDEAEDGVEAVEKLRCSLLPGNRPFDAVLMDNMMPNMDGPTAAKEMRALGYTGKIIGITGNVNDEDVAKFISLGADKVLAKPLDVDQLLAALEEASQARVKPMMMVQNVSRFLRRPSAILRKPSDGNKIPDLSGQQTNSGSMSEMAYEFAAKVRRQSFATPLSLTKASPLPVEGNSGPSVQRNDDILKAKSATKESSSMRLRKYSSSSIMSKPPLGAPRYILIVQTLDTNQVTMERLSSTGEIVQDLVTDGSRLVAKVVKSIQGKDPYGAVIMDYQMPTTTALEAAIELRAIGYKGKIVCVLPNASESHVHVHKSYEKHGVDTVLVKPLDTTVIQAMLTDVFRTSDHGSRCSSGLKSTAQLRRGSVSSYLRGCRSEEVAIAPSIDELHLPIHPKSPLSKMDPKATYPTAVPAPPISSTRLLSSRSMAPASSTAAGVDSSLGDLAVLVVSADDSRRSRMAPLRGKCCVYNEAIDGMEAISTMKTCSAQGQRIDVIILDLHLTDMDGPVAASELRKLGFNGKIVGILDSNSSDDTQVFLSEGGNFVISEPIDLTALTQYLEEIRSRYHDSLNTQQDERMRPDDMLEKERLPYMRNASKRVFPCTPSEDITQVISKTLSMSRSETFLHSDDEDSLTLGTPRSAASSVGSLRTKRVNGGRKEVLAALNSHGTPHGHNKFHILIAEDSVIERKKVNLMLCGRAAGCVEASDGIQVVERVGASLQRGLPFDAVILNASLPSLDGQTCVRALRAMGYIGKIICLIHPSSSSSSMIPSNSVDHFRSIGADAVYSTPLQLADFDDVMLAKTDKVCD